MAFKKPVEIAQAAVAAGKAKTALPIDKMLLLGFLAGAYIAFGGLLAVLVGGGLTNKVVVGETTFWLVGIQKLLFAGVFPVGLMLVVIGGAELFTGNCMLIPIAVYHKEAKWSGLLNNWLWVYIGNFIGSLFVAYFLTTLTGFFATAPWNAYIQGIAYAKTGVTVGADGAITLAPAGAFMWKMFWRSVGCNWLVTMAVWLSIAADDVVGKVFAIWFPIMAFVGMGFEHSVANMFFIPAGIWAGAKVSTAQFLINNLLPVTLGNILVGMVMVAGIYYYVYLKDEKKA